MSAHPKVLAAEVARRVGLPASWPNVNVIAAAIELVTSWSGVSAEEAAELLVQCAHERTPGPRYSLPSEWEKREIFRENSVSRFWFEDSRWTAKLAYAEFYAKVTAAEVA
jgi:hypothetical protein